MVVLEHAVALGLAEYQIGILSDSDVCGERDERTGKSVMSHCFGSGGFVRLTPNAIRPDPLRTRLYTAGPEPFMVSVIP